MDQFTIQDLPMMANIASILDDDKLSKLASQCIEGYKIDKDSRADKEQAWDAADDAFKLKREGKSYPFQNAANVKYPMLLEAAIDFQSRAMPAVINNGKVWKSKVIGSDPQGVKSQQGYRVETYMNWQVLERDDQWTDETDKLMLQIPIYGSGYKKLYNDPVRGNVSELVSAKSLVVNSRCTTLNRAPRVTQEFDLYPYEMQERRLSGLFLDIDLTDKPAKVSDKTDGAVEEDNRDDDQQPHEFLEQHCWYDMDEDGYPEPYIVTLHRGSEKIVRITAGFDERDIIINQGTGQVAKIKRRPVFVKYGFIPDPDGGFYDIGFGELLHDPVNVINSLINQILDAGSLQNAGGGFIGKEFRLKAGTMTQELGKWKQVPFAGQDIRQAIVPFEHRGPSAVLFQMLGFMVDMAKGLTAQRDVLTGDAPANQPASTTLALIEQGLKVFTGIIGRILRSVAAEGQALYELNARYMDEQEYVRIGDDEGYVMRADFDTDASNISSVADSSVVTDMQRMARAEALMQFRGDPLISQQMILQRYFEAAGIDPNGLVQEQQPDPMQIEAAKAELEKLLADIEKAKASAAKDAAGAVKTMAEVDQQDRKLDIEEAGKAIDALRMGGEFAMRTEGNDIENESGDIRGMAREPGNRGSFSLSESLLTELGELGEGPGLAGGFSDPGTAGGFVQ
jgi:chaperonin GroES